MKLTIITITFNDKEGLVRTLGSVQNQDFKDYEHVIIDGGSSDGSKEVIESSKELFSYWVSEPDHGIYDAMNKGIARAKGDYILFLNSGDILHHKGVLTSVSPVLSSNYDIVYGDLWIEGADGVGFTNAYPVQVDFAFLKTTSLGHPATFIKRSLFETYGFYRTDLKIVSDWAFFVKTLGANVVSQKKVNTVISRFYEGGVSTTPESLHLHLQERKKVLKEYFDQYDEAFEHLIEKYRNESLIWDKIDRKIYVIATNKHFLKILNTIIAFLGKLLILKRKWFNNNSERG